MDTTVFPGLSLPPELPPLTALSQRFESVAGGAVPAVTLEGRRFLHLPHATLRMAQVRDLLRLHLVPRRDDDDIWSYLITRMVTDGEAAVVVCAGMALPTLTALAQHLAPALPGGTRAAQAVILSAFLTEAGVIDCAAPSIFRRLIRQTWRTGREATTAPATVVAPRPTGDDIADHLDTGEYHDDDDLLGDHDAIAFSWNEHDNTQPWGEVPAVEAADLNYTAAHHPVSPVRGGRVAAHHQGRRQCRPSMRPGTQWRRAWVTGLATIVALVAAAGSASAGPLPMDPAHTVALAGSLQDVLNNLRNWVMGILATAATVFLTVAGARYVLAGGDPGEIEKAKTAFKTACYGYAAAALAPVIVSVLKQIVGA